MAKRSYKRPTARSEKERPGCMGGLISIFDFRLGHSTRKLISDRRRGNGRHAAVAGYSKSRFNLLTNGNRQHNGKDVTVSNLYDSNKTKTAKIESDQTSIKALVDDEVSKIQFSKKQIPRTAVEQIRSDFECRSHTGNSHKQTYKTSNLACDLHLNDSLASTSLQPQLKEQEMHQKHTNGTGSFLARKSSSHMNMQQVQKHVVKEKLNEATESFLNQKLMNAKRFIRDGAAHQSKEFMDALEVLNSNKELFLKLLQDPNSLLVKHIEDLRNAQLEKVSKEEVGNSTQLEKPISHTKFQKQNFHNFLKRKEKTENRSISPTKVSDSTSTSSRIVILKPSPEISKNCTTTFSPNSTPRSHYTLRKQVESERVTTNYSIREITRKLKNAIGEGRKEKRWISMDGILHRIPYVHHDSRDTSKRIAGKNQSRVENEVALHNSDNCVNSDTTAIGHPQQRRSTVYGEGGPVKIQSIDMVPRTSRRMLSLPEYSMSPRLSPGRDKEPTFVHGQMRFSSPHEIFRFGRQLKRQISAESSSPLRLNLETSSCIDCNNQDSELLQMPNSNSERLKEQNTVTKLHMSRVSSPKGCNMIVQVTDVAMEESNHLGVPSGPDNNNNNNDVTVNMREGGSFEHLKMESLEKPTLASTLGSFAGSPLLIHKINVPSIDEKPERPSPVSVLEPFFIESIISPSSPLQAEFAVEPQPIQPEEEEEEEEEEEDENSALWLTTLDPKTSPITCVEGKEDEFKYARIMMEASGLSYSEFIAYLFDQIETSSVHLSNNRELLFDCINEVLMDVYERFFSCSPWVSFVNTNILPIPVGRHVVQEVWLGIEWHSLLQFPSTLDQIIGKDLAKSGSWMDLRFDVEVVSVEMGDSILEEIMEETILELWN